MRYELERAFAIFEMDVFERFGLKPKELDDIDMFTLHSWFKEKNERLIKQQQQINFDRLKQHGTKKRM